MGLFERFGLKKNNGLKESAPVIGRKGRIGRVSVDDELAHRGEKEPEKKAIGYDESVADTTGVSISDSEFLQSAGEPKGKKSKKRDFFTNDRKEKTPFPFLTVVAMGFATLLFMSLVVNFVEVNEYTKDLAALRSQVEATSKERDELKAELDEKDSIDALRKYMEEQGNTLGMIEESEMKAPVAITPEKSDGIEDFEVPSQEEPIVTVVLNALARNLSDVWNKFLG